MSASLDHKTVSVTKLTSLVTLLKKYGINTDDFFDKAGFDTKILEYPDNKIHLKEFERLITLAAQKSGDGRFALHQGQSLGPGFSNIITYILINCDTVDMALKKFCKYEKLIDEGTRTGFFIDGDSTVITVSIADKTLGLLPNVSEFFISAIKCYGSLLSGMDFNPKKVMFRHGLTGSIEGYEKLFKCPIVFNSDYNALVVDSRAMKTPIKEPNRNLLKHFEQYADEILDNIEGRETYTDKVNRFILRNLQGEPPAIGTIARDLDISVRTLQLNLKKEGVSYRDLLSTMRKELALRYLKNDKVTIGEIAYILGFSEGSAFYRTFKKWTGYAPGEYRKKFFE